jgi:WD40 repeat protein
MLLVGGAYSKGHDSNFPAMTIPTPEEECSGSHESMARVIPTRCIYHGGHYSVINNSHTGQQFVVSPVRALDQTSEVRGVLFSAGGDVVAIILDQSVRVCFTDTGDHIFTYCAEIEEASIWTALCAAFSQDASYLALAGTEGSIKMVSVQDKHVNVFGRGHDCELSFLHISNDHFSVFSGSAMDGTIRTWDAVKGTQRKIWYIPADLNVSEMAASRDCRIVACTDQKSLYLFDTEAGTLLRRLEGVDFVSDMIFSPATDQLAAYSRNSEVVLWRLGWSENVDAKEIVKAQIMPIVLDVDFDISGVAWTTDSKSLLVEGRTGGIQLWDSQSCQPQFLLLPPMKSGNCIPNNANEEA